MTKAYHDNLKLFFISKNTFANDIFEKIRSTQI